MIQLTQALAARPVIAVMRAPRADRFVAAAEVLAEAGFPAVEFTLTSDGAVDAIRKAREYLPDLVVGAGTVRTLDQVQQAIDAGASFLVSQVASRALVEAAHARDVPFVPGALTPTEIVAAWDIGVQAVKVSPAGTVGGPDYIEELVGPLPGIPLMPTGRVGLDEVGDYLAAGAAMVGLSRDLLRDSLTPGGSVRELAARAARAIRSLDLSLETSQ